MPRRSLGLSHLLRLDRQLHQDESESLRALQERDRAIGTSLKERSPQHRLLAWLEAVSGSPLRRPAVEAALPVLVSALGFLLGILTMGGLLLVEQQRPVNVLVFLALFVGLQLLLLVLTLGASLFLAVRGDSAFTEAHFNIIHWLVRRSYQRLSKELRPDQFAPLLRWLMLSLGQLFGVCFNAGALIALLTILLLVDRSFGWSSTLDISAGGLHQLLNAMAAPWSWFWPAAGVDMTLVENTRYQSLQQHFDAEQVQAMRRWWPFLCAAILFYGLLPRVLLWITFQCIYRRRLRLAFVNYPGAGLVLNRMNSPLVHTQSSGHEKAEATSGAQELRRAVPEGNLIQVDWSHALAGRSQLQDKHREVHSAGINLQEDEALLHHINQQKQDVLVFVKSWEPPLSELGDFLRGISPKLNCYLYLLPLAGEGVKAEALSDWQHFARQGHHPRLLLIVADEKHSAGAES